MYTYAYVLVHYRLTTVLLLSITSRYYYQQQAGTVVTVHIFLGVGQGENVVYLYNTDITGNPPE